MFFLIGAIDVRKSLRRSEWRVDFKMKLKLRYMRLKLKSSCLEIKVEVELR